MIQQIKRSKVASIVACGSSALETYDPSDPETIASHRIFINGAVAVDQYGACDWWCAGDLLCFDRWKVRPTTGICSMDDTIQQIRADQYTHRNLKELVQIGWNRLPYVAQHAINFSGNSAMLLAAMLGARTIHLYGYDCTEEQPRPVETAIRNSPLCSNNPRRWENERTSRAPIMAELKSLGIEIVRHLPEHSRAKYAEL